MKQLVELIEIEKSFIRRKKQLKKDYQLKTQDYISKTKESIDDLNNEILNKNQIVAERLAAHSGIQTDSKEELKLDSQKIKSLILNQL